MKYLGVEFKVIFSRSSEPLGVLIIPLQVALLRYPLRLGCWDRSCMLLSYDCLCFRY